MNFFSLYYSFFVVCSCLAFVNADVDKWPSLEEDHTKLQIIVPESLQLKGGYQHRDALFGYPGYSVGSIQTQLIYTNGSACDKLDSDQWVPPFALLIDRGGCHFVEKVRNAQHAGARAVVIADNMCLCSDKDCMKLTGDVICESVLPYMADDSSGGDITIPSMLIRKSDAARIKNVMKESTTISNVMVKFDWGIPSPDGRVEWTMWHSSWDEASLKFLKEVEETVLALGSRAFFTPHFVSYNGTKVGCHASETHNPCGNMCLNAGRYCLLDPSPRHDQFEGASGMDVVIENLRRRCIWDLETVSDPGIGKKWWTYVNKFGEVCSQNENSFKDSQCAISVMKSCGINVDEVNKCMQPYGADVDEVNEKLESELREQTGLQLLRLPTFYVDGVHARGRVDPANVLTMVCAGYGVHDPPTVCNCVNQPYASLMECVQNGGYLKSQQSSQGGMGTFQVLVLLFAVVGAVGGAGFVYWRRTQRHMREQVRSILAEYMPLEDQSCAGEGDSPRMHPAAVAASKSPRGYLPTKGFNDDNDDDEDGV